MPTILERFKTIGLPINKSELSWAGERVSESFCKKNLHGRTLKEQTESGETFKVWDYPESWIDEMDAIILKMVDNG